MSKRTSSTSPRPLLLAWLLAIGGCFDDCGSDDPYDSQPGPGELGRGDFHYLCINDGDPTCREGSSVGNFPARVAVGGRFELDYTWNESSSEKRPPDLRSAAPERLSAKNEIFTPLVAGYTAVLAVMPDSSIADLIHIHASVPTQIAFRYLNVDYSAYTVAESEEIRFDTVLRDDEAYALAGLLKLEFAVDDPAIVEVVTAGDRHVILRALSEGTTRVHATLGDLTAALDVTVEAGDPLTTGTSTGDSTATTDDSTSTTDDSTSTTDATSTGDTDASSTGDTDTTGGGP